MNNLRNHCGAGLFEMDVPDEQLRRYADVICAWQGGGNAGDIAEAFSLPGPLVQDWIMNFIELDRAS